MYVNIYETESERGLNDGFVHGVGTIIIGWIEWNWMKLNPK
jgi:hypothetical protein